MALIKDRKRALDNWQRLETDVDSALTSIGATVDIIVPLAVWQANRTLLIAREGRVGIWLAPHDDPQHFAQDFAHVAVIAVQFTSFTDGRGYSIGRLLRQRYAWQGELRAIGDIQRDQLLYLSRCGFDAFELRAGEDIEGALGAFDDFSESYQAAVEPVLPLFRRREAGLSA